MSIQEAQEKAQTEATEAKEAFKRKMNTWARRVALALTVIVLVIWYFVWLNS